MTHNRLTQSEDHVITVTGALDARGVADVESALRKALERSPSVEVNLLGVEHLSQEAIHALADCARLGLGIRFRVAGTALSPRGSR